MNKIQAMLDKIAASPTSFQAAAVIQTELEKAGYEQLKEHCSWTIQPHGKYYLLRNLSSIIAFQIPADVKDLSFHIAASHSDSPSYKVKPNAIISADSHYLKLNTEGYGGMLAATWMDRPLSLAGRVIVKEKEGLKETLITIDRDLVMIPSLAIHMNREANNGYAYNAQTDMLPLIALDDQKEFDLKELLAKELKIEKEAVFSFDLYLYNREAGRIWGMNQEFMSIGHLDDLECAFTSLDAFLSVSSLKTVNVYCCFDNEEVGSRTRQGAASTFLYDVLTRIVKSLALDEEAYHKALASSLMISADNAHAVHPNHEDKSDPTNRVYMNEGIVIKCNANQSYTSDSVSSALFMECCRKAGVPFQYFTNRSDLKGGGTLGNISSQQVSVPCVDIGLAQLAMHSAYETAGVKDAEYMIEALKTFYSSHIEMKESGHIQITFD